MNAKIYRAKRRASIPINASMLSIPVRTAKQRPIRPSRRTGSDEMDDFYLVSIRKLHRGPLGPREYSSVHLNGDTLWFQVQICYQLRDGYIFLHFFLIAIHDYQHLSPPTDR